MTYQVPDTRNQENVTRSRAVLEPAAADLEAELQAIDPSAEVVVTGSAVYRDDQLAAIRRALLLALPISVVACFLVAAAFMRSIRYALVSIVPILLVVSWLYGIMYEAGYSINVVTAIIGAVSVGIGIDFSTHYTMRFLEERQRGLPKRSALAAAGAGTGAALLGSALTSVAGFGALALAPMPMFASYGLLTAIMIVLALIAALFVLPSLLSLVTRREDRASGLRAGDRPVRIGVASDVSEAVVGHLSSIFDSKVRNPTVTVTVHAVGVVPGLVESEAIDLGLVVRWPGTPAPEGLDLVPLVDDELMVVGGEGVGSDPIPADQLTHTLLVAESSSHDGALRSIRHEIRYPVLAHTAPDVATGMRLATVTGGAMVLPRSMVGAAGSLRVRSFDPPLRVETLLAVAPSRASDPLLLDLVTRLMRAIEGDERLGRGAVMGSHAPKLPVP